MMNHEAQGADILSLQSNINKILIATNEKDIFNVCSNIVDSLKASYFTYYLIQPNDFHSIEYKIISNFNPCWVDRYKDQSYILVDPSIKECRESSTPIYWSTQKYNLEKLSVQSKAMIKDAYKYGLRAGILAPVFDCHGIKGIFEIGIGCDLYNNHSQEQLMQLAPYVSYIGGYMHQSMIKLHGLENFIQKEPLTNREKDCLCWAADGKTASEIGSKLCISENTVKFHSKNIMKKLGARNTAQALAIGILNGLIQPAIAG